LYVPTDATRSSVAIAAVAVPLTNDRCGLSGGRCDAIDVMAWREYPPSTPVPFGLWNA
jgi:hypothetical protein